MAKLEILKAAVYCGTYSSKYNAGSIDGAWMQLAKYQTNEEFLEGRDEVAIAKRYSDQACGVIYYILDPDYATTDGVTKLTKEETFDLKEKYLKAVYILRAKFVKQIDSYLKRYGLTKIRKWTYCSDD